MLLKEYGDSGINIRDLAEKGKTRKLAVIPELVAATVSGDYDSNTLDHLEDILGSYAGSKAAGKALAGASILAYDAINKWAETPKNPTEVRMLSVVVRL